MIFFFLSYELDIFFLELSESTWWIEGEKSHREIWKRKKTKFMDNIKVDYQLKLADVRE